MKKSIAVGMVLILIVLTGCSSVANGSTKEGVEKYLEDQQEYMEPTCTEWENGEITVEWENEEVPLENGILYSAKTGKKKVILEKINNWALFSEHSLLIIYDDYYLIEINTQNWTQNTLYESSIKMNYINTNGALAFFSNANNEIYRYYVPTGELDLMATDEMFAYLLSPLTTTDICWASYNPLWLKKFYELGDADNIYNIYSTFFTFCDTNTGKVYTWNPETASESYDAEGVEWYHKQKQSY